MGIIFVFMENKQDSFRAIAFSALMLLVGWQEGHLAHKKTEWWGAGMVICLRLMRVCFLLVATSIISHNCNNMITNPNHVLQIDCL